LAKELLIKVIKKRKGKEVNFGSTIRADEAGKKVFSLKSKNKRRRMQQ
jgi:hypothetical protein